MNGTLITVATAQAGLSQLSETMAAPLLVSPSKCCGRKLGCLHPAWYVIGKLQANVAHSLTPSVPPPQSHVKGQPMRTWEVVAATGGMYSYHIMSNMKYRVRFPAPNLCLNHGPH